MVERVSGLFEVLLAEGVQLEEPFGSFTIYLKTHALNYNNPLLLSYELLSINI